MMGPGVRGSGAGSGIRARKRGRNLNHDVWARCAVRVTDSTTRVPGDDQPGFWEVEDVTCCSHSQAGIMHHHPVAVALPGTRVPAGDTRVPGYGTVTGPGRS
eukprot:403667-Rhodomonas_salina.3